jgi:putative hydrolase of the HAD superfamily
VNELDLLFVTDADNTLWDTDSVYREAQLALLADVERASGLRCPTDQRLLFVREVDQSIAAEHHQGLKYPAILLANALCSRLQGVPPDQASRRSVQNGTIGSYVGAADAADRFVTALLSRPTLRAGVREGLELLKGHGIQTVIATEGSRNRVAQELVGYDFRLSDFRIVAAPKTTRLFERLGRLGSEHATRVMVGDQPKRDLIPAALAGFRTVYFQGGFEQLLDGRHSRIEADKIVTDYLDAVSFALATAHLNIKARPALQGSCEIHNGPPE